MEENTKDIELNNTSITEESKVRQGVFDELLPELQQAVAAEGYTAPTSIQEQAIPQIRAGRDLMGCAQTGTGKTAAFALPVLQKLSEVSESRQKGKPKALILAPTRELAVQIDKSFHTYGEFLRLKHTVVCGGVRQKPQEKALNGGVDVLVATPGRLLDLIRQKIISLRAVKTFVLDEMDRMLDMGFIPDIKKIIDQLPTERQTLFFSATINQKMASLAEGIVKDPVHVHITPEQPAVEGVAQKVFFVEKQNKNSLLISLLNEAQTCKALVFTQMKHVADRVVKKLQNSGIDSDVIHGDKSQGARDKALKKFRQGRTKVLVATDVAARGLDVDDISHVINYDLPGEAEVYVHRIGRTARAGAEGNAVSFCSAEDLSYLKAIEKVLGEPVPPETEQPYHCNIAFKLKHEKGKKSKRKGRGKSYGNRQTGRSARRQSGSRRQVSR